MSLRGGLREGGIHEELGILIGGREERLLFLKEEFKVESSSHLLVCLD